MTHSSIDLSQLQTHEWEQLHALASRLEEAWEGADSVDLGPLLPPPGSSLRPTFLYELVRTDLEIRHRRQRPLPLEDYCTRYPELGAPATLPVPLIFEEFQVRQRHGDHPPLDGYRSRFPAQFEELCRIVQTHCPPTQCVPAAPVTAPGTVLDEVSATRDPSATGPAPSLPTFLPPRPLSGGREILPLAEGYILQQRLGAGQFGEVFQAQAPGGVSVAVKRIFRAFDDESGQRELQSLHLIKELRHPYLLQTQMFWIHGDRLHIVMELAEDSLADWLQQCQIDGQTGIPVEDLLRYFAEAAEALDFLHDRHLMHRDIKPANLLRLRGHAKVADFGLARLLEEEQATSTFCGTPAYMAPEIWEGQVSIHSDQYGLAVTYAEMRQGRRPFRGNSQLEIGAQHLHSQADLDGLPEVERAVVLRALALDPEQRYPTCRDFVQALAAAVAPPPPRPRSLVPLVVGAVALTVLLPVAWWFLRPPPVPAEPPPWLPEGYAAAEDARVEHGLYDRIRFPLEEAPPLEFLLIPRTRTDDPPPFYALRDKVTGGQLRAVARTARYRAILGELAGKQPWAVRHKRETEWLPQSACTAWAAAGGPVWMAALPALLFDSARSALPVTDVTVLEAHCFAAAVGGLLPSAREWDKAAGRFEGQGPGPYRAGWKEGDPGIALERDWPAPAGTSPADESVFGCRDMAGNGREFTRNLALSEGTVPAPDADPDRSRVELRGQSFLRARPLQFEELGEVGRAAVIEYRLPRFDVSFRVVVELPVER